MTSYSQNFDAATPPSAPSGWTFSTNTSTATSGSAYSGTKVMTSTGGAVETGMYTTADLGSGSLVATLSVYAGSGSPEALVVIRGTTTSWNTMSSYVLDLTVNNSVASGVAIAKTSAGSLVILSGSRVGSLSAFPSGGAGYNLEMHASGTTTVALTGYVQRRSDGYWLNSAGVWQAVKVAACSASDSTSPLSPTGYFGAAMYSLGGASGAFIDDFAIAPLTSSTSYYVSPSGSDTNDGFTSASAWQTIAQVNSVTYSPGTTISFQGGQSFSGNLLINSSGTASSPIVVSSYGTGKATINAGNANGVQVLNAEYVHIDNLVLTGSGVSTSTGATTNVGAGVDFKSTATTGARLNGCSATRLTISGFRTGVLLEANSGSYPQTAWRGFDGAVVTNCDISLCSSAGIYTWALSNNGTFSGSDGTFPQLATNHTVHSNIHITDIYVHDIYGYDGTGAPYPYQATRSGAGIRVCNMSHGLIEYCRVDNAGHMGNGVQSPANFESEASEYLVWQFNESSNCRTTGSNDGAGFDVFDGGAQYATVQYNWVHENDGYGVGGGGVGSGFDGGSVTGNTVRFNVLANNNQRSINGDLQFWGGFTNLAVYNNTIFSNLNTSTLIAIPAAVTSSYIRNNILVSLGTRSLLSGGTTANTPAFQGNLYWRGSGGAALGLTMNSTTSNTIADWRATGQELYRNAGSGLVSDPAFSSAGSLLAELPTSLVSVMASYDTTGGSAARGSAISPSDWGEYPGPIDFHGKFLNLSVFDIGAPQATTR